MKKPDTTSETAVPLPLSSKYDPRWVRASASGGANAIRLTEWLCQSMRLSPGSRVLDLGCGRAASSIFLAREFGAQVFAVDLWFDPTENLQRIREAEVVDRVFPLRADARALPFARGFFDAVVCVDAFMYFGTDDNYLPQLARLCRHGAQIGIAMSGLTKDVSHPVPDHLREWWTPEMFCLHTAAWYAERWSRTGLVEMELADAMPFGWREWADWQRENFPDNQREINAVEQDGGQHLGYIRVVAKRSCTEIEDPIERIPFAYTPGKPSDFSLS